MEVNNEKRLAIKALGLKITDLFTQEEIIEAANKINKVHKGRHNN